MEANNSMISHSSINSKSNSRSNEQSSNITMSMSVASIKSKNKKTKKPKGQTFSIVCKKDPNITFGQIDEEFSVHIIKCDDCLKEFLLYQARKEKLGSEILNDKKEDKKKSIKKRKKILILIIQ